MESNNRIEKIQEEYFSFCLELLQKLSNDENLELLIAKAYELRNEIKEQISLYLKNLTIIP
jgi:hypothetical protein